jgi:hypothetical protein
MSRQLDSTLATGLSAGTIMPVLLAQITFRSGAQYVWTGVGSLSYGGHIYLGVGSLAGIGVVVEGIDVQADGTTVTLSGIDPVLLAESMTDVQLGAPATIWFGLMSGGALLGSPAVLFKGQVDQPTVTHSGDTISISLKLENRLVNMQRASMRRYTAADQRLARCSQPDGRRPI